ncbi:hypothetical protein JFL47_04485 [Haemophilus haemoglobinophilus]|nr:hypothetical protein [Canicola haemoglobinophilus]
MLSKLKLIEQPIISDTQEAWAKLLEDIAKISIVSFPIVAYSEHTLFFKIVNLILLILISYYGLVVAKKLRENKLKGE